MDGDTKQVMPCSSNDIWHITNAYDLMPDDHQIELDRLFAGLEEEEIIDQLTIMLDKHALPSWERQADLKQIGIDETNSKVLATQLYPHARKRGTLVLLHNPGDFAIWKPHDPDGRYPAKKSYYFLLEVPPNGLVQPSGKVKSNKQPRYLFFPMVQYDYWLPIYEHRPVDREAILARGKELLDMLKEHRTSEDKRLRSDATKYLAAMTKLKEGLGRLCDATLLALGFIPAIDIAAVPPGVERMTLFEGFDYSRLSDEELIVGIFHHYRVADPQKRLTGNTAYLTPRLKGPLAVMYYVTETCAKLEDNRMNLSRVLRLFKQSFSIYLREQ